MVFESEGLVDVDISSDCRQLLLSYSRRVSPNSSLVPTSI
jgi:hypothetical protein